MQKTGRRLPASACFTTVTLITYSLADPELNVSLLRELLIAAPSEYVTQRKSIPA
jgi:hypothetical protein